MSATSKTRRGADTFLSKGLKTRRKVNTYFHKYQVYLHNFNVFPLADVSGALAGVARSAPPQDRLKNVNNRYSVKGILTRSEGPSFSIIFSSRYRQRCR